MNNIIAVVVLMICVFVAGVLFAIGYDFLKRVKNMLGWFETVKPIASPPETKNGIVQQYERFLKDYAANYKMPLEVLEGRAAPVPDPIPPKEEKPFWDDYEQLTRELERVENGETIQADGDSVDYVRKLAQRKAELEETRR